MREALFQVWLALGILETSKLAHEHQTGNEIVSLHFHHSHQRVPKVTRLGGPGAWTQTWVCGTLSFILCAGVLTGSSQ